MTERATSGPLPIDDVVRAALSEFSESWLHHRWYGKEHNWVSLFAFAHLVKACRPGTMLFDPARIAIEVGVPQPEGFQRKATRRDIVVWREPGSSCWNLIGEPCHHPVAILEWKVHRPGFRNRLVERERRWLRAYSAWQADVVCYAVELELGGEHASMDVTRFHAATEAAFPVWRTSIGGST